MEFFKLYSVLRGVGYILYTCSPIDTRPIEDNNNNLYYVTTTGTGIQLELGASMTYDIQLQLSCN